MMKMTTEHREFIANRIKSLPLGVAYHREYLASPANPRPPKDLEKRLRWDLLYLAVPSAWVCDNLYPYLNDTHIDTALRAIVGGIAA